MNMALKTDYKDAIYDGNRKYTKAENDDGTISLVDATSYSQEGDLFGADDINATNTVVNAIQDLMAPISKTVTLSASGWSSGVYKLSDADITSTSMNFVEPAEGITKAQNSALMKGEIVCTEQGTGYITLKALGTVPTVDIPIKLTINRTMSTEGDATYITDAKGYADQAKASAESIVDNTHPVGCIYMAVNTTSPADLFGGTWEQLSSQLTVGTESLNVWKRTA